MLAVISVTSSVTKQANYQTGRQHGEKSSNKAQVDVTSANIETNRLRSSRHLEKEGL